MKLDDAFGIHEQALLLRGRRSEVLASNLVNADTPGYKARDFDFQAVLRGEMDASQPVRLAATRPGHIAPAQDSFSPAELLYRTPSQPSLDGNTVDVQQEQVEFGANSLSYQASLRFLNGKISGLLRAIKGE